MARPIKIGLDYFPFDIDFFNDIKIRKLIRNQGGKAVAVYACLLCNIYKSGYYMRWDNELPFILSEILGYDEAYIQEVIKNCFALDLLSREMFEKNNVLTSKGIQTRYEDIYKLSKRRVCLSEFALVSSEETPVNSEETPVNSEFSTQRKGNKRKENNIPPLYPPAGGNDVAGDLFASASGHGFASDSASGHEFASDSASGQEQPVTPEPVNGAYTFFLSEFNRIKGSRFRKNGKTERQFRARLKEGFTVENMLGALQNAMKARNHIESGLKYLTPEFFTRPDKIELYGQPERQAPQGVKTGIGVWIEGGKKFYGDRHSPVEIPLDAPERIDGGSFYNPHRNKWEVC
jgi:hypothetical protein